MMRRAVIVVALLGCLVMTSGCVSTIAKRTLGEVMPYDVRYVELAGGSGSWTTFQSFQFGGITDGMNGRVPSELSVDLKPMAEEELRNAKLFQVVGASSGRTLVMTGEVIDCYAGSSGESRAIGFGNNPSVTVRARFVDAASGTMLSEVNLESRSKSLRNWAEMVSRGLGKAVAEYLKDKGMQKLPDQAAN